MPSLREKYEELLIQHGLLKRQYVAIERKWCDVSGKAEKEKEKIEKILRQERKNAFEKYCRKQDKDYESKIDQLTDKNKEAEEQKRELASRNEELQQKIDHLESVLSLTINQCNDLERKEKELKQILHSERQKFSDEVNAAMNKITNLEENLRTSYEQSSALFKEIEKLKQERTTFQDMSTRAQEQLQYHLVSLTTEEKEHVPFPSDWDPMPDNTNCKQYPVTEDEYNKMSRRFLETIGGIQVNIIRIDRVQNKCLYKQYHMKKIQIRQHSSSSEEKLLWHGTYGEALTGIIVNGFDRGYGGYNVGEIHGHGVYFSTSSNYSVSYSKPDVNGQRHMFLARVLTGDRVVGKKEYRVLPIKDRSTYTRYDSLVNRLDSSSIFVIMNDTQAYPEYLVTYEVITD